jgi:subtilase family serine protease
MLVSRVALGAALALSLGVASAGAAETEISMGATAATQSVPFQVFLPLTNTARLDQFLADAVNPAKPDVYHHWLTPAQFKAAYGPSPSAIATVKAELAKAGMTVTAEHTQSLEVTGPASAAESMFNVHLQTMRSVSTGLQRHVAIEGHTTLPASFAAVGAHVVGFESQIFTKVHSQRMNMAAGKVPAARLNAGPNQGYFFNDMKAGYSFPSFQTFSEGTGLGNFQQIVGLGTNIGILMSSIALNSDLALQMNSTVQLNGGGSLTQAYSANSDLPVPQFQIREVSGGSGPFGDSAADEASLDTQASLGTAQGATEELYDIPDLSDSSILAGYTAIVEDNTVDVVSASFGGDENLEVLPNPANGFVSQAFVLTVMHQIFEQGNAQGITFLASSGDHGSLPSTTDFSQGGYINTLVTGTGAGVSPAAPGVEDPASDSDVTAVGGSNLATTSSAASEDGYFAENSVGDPLVSPFNAFGGSSPTGGLTGMFWGSGGGVSVFTPKPAYQNLVPTGETTMRAVPDIAMQMGGCPGGIQTAMGSAFCDTQQRSFSLVFIGGELSGLIGTSSSSPQFAGVVAHMVQLAGGGSGAAANPPFGQAFAPVGRLGNINTMLYTLAAQQVAAGGPQAPANQQFFHRRIQGFSGAFSNNTDMPYSLVLGVGTPNITNLLGLQGATPAGNPGTITNP